MSDASRPVSLEGRHVDAMFSHLTLFIFGGVALVSAVNTSWAASAGSTVAVIAVLAFTGGLALHSARHLAATRRLVLADPTSDADWQRAARRWFL